jgi:Condensation domain
MRLKLIRTAEDRHELIWSNHHLLLDGWSSYVVLNEVMELYGGICEQRNVVLENRRPYRDYIRWLQQQDLCKAEEFWRATLAGFSAPTPFHIDQSGKKQSGQFVEFQNQELEFSPETTDRLKAFCRQRNLTLNTLMQAAWALLLSRYSGEEDVLFGSVVSGRPAEIPGVESMVGMFINTLPVRVRVGNGDVVSSWLQNFQGRLVELREYEQSPLVEVQGWSEVPHGQPLFESLFDFVNYPIDPFVRQQQSGVQLANIRAIDKTNYPITFTVDSTPKHLCGCWAIIERCWTVLLPTLRLGCLI